MDAGETPGSGIMSLYLSIPENFPKLHSHEYTKKKKQFRNPLLPPSPFTRQRKLTGVCTLSLLP